MYNIMLCYPLAQLLFSKHEEWLCLPNIYLVEFVICFEAIIRVFLNKVYWAPGTSLLFTHDISNKTLFQFLPHQRIE